MTQTIKNRRRWKILTTIRTAPSNLKALQRDLPNIAPRSKALSVTLLVSGIGNFGVAEAVLYGTAVNDDGTRLPHDMDQAVRRALGKGTFHVDVDTLVEEIK